MARRGGHADVRDKHYLRNELGPFQKTDDQSTLQIKVNSLSDDQ